LLMNTGTEARKPSPGLVTTIAWGLGREVTYALEGSIFVTGAAVQWLRDEMNIISAAEETEWIAASVPDTGGVYLVPAFTGLGAPYWDPYARGTIVGLTRGTGRAHIVRATLEAAAYQSRDVMDEMARTADVRLAELRVDGGMARNDFLLQFQADINGTVVSRPVTTETTVLGAAYLAGLSVGLWESPGTIEKLWRLDRRFQPAMNPDERTRRYDGWQRAVERSRGWARSLHGDGS